MATQRKFTFLASFFLIAANHIPISLNRWYRVHSMHELFCEHKLYTIYSSVFLNKMCRCKIILSNCEFVTNNSSLLNLVRNKKVGKSNMQQIIVSTDSDRLAYLT